MRSLQAGEETLSSDETHFVWVIHGTFNAPEEGSSPKWYQLDSKNTANFCFQLNELLKGGPLKEALWRPIDNPSSPDFFAWTGENDHGDRIQAARQLCDKLINLTRQHPKARVHLVAHSHGGNVALKAIEFYLNHLISLARRTYRAMNGNRLQKGQSPDLAVDNAIEEIFPHDTSRPPQWLVEYLRHCAHELASIHRGTCNSSYVSSQDEATKKALFRHADALEDLWTGSLETNRLGRVVLLGTPFIRKQWTVSKSPSTRFFTYCVKNVLTIPFFFAMIYCGVLALWLPLGFLPWVPWPSMNPLTWPSWLLVSSIFYAIALFASHYETVTKYNVNAYFNPNHLLDVASKPRERSQTPPPGIDKSLMRPRLQTLVVTSKYLDEAVLALSAEPFASATLFPEIHKIVYAKPAWPYPFSKRDDETNREISTPYHGGMIGFFTIPVRWAAEWLALFGYYALLPLWAPVRKLIIEPLIQRAVLKAITTTTYGIPAHLLTEARVLLQTDLNQPEFFEEHFWDITDSVLSQEKQQRSEKLTPRDLSLQDRFAHLKYIEVLHQKQDIHMRKEKSFWRKIATQAEALYARYDSGFMSEPNKVFGTRITQLTYEQFQEELALNWFTVSERLKEISGAVELAHSTYYSNREVIEAIARFLSHGIPPVEATSRKNERDAPVNSSVILPLRA